MPAAVLGALHTVSHSPKSYKNVLLAPQDHGSPYSTLPLDFAFSSIELPTIYSLRVKTRVLSFLHTLPYLAQSLVYNRCLINIY